MRQYRPDVGAVLARAGLQEIEQDIARLEDTRVVGEQAEDGPHQEPLQVVASVPRVIERIVQPSYQFRDLDVCGILVAKAPPLHSDDESEGLDLRGEIGKREGHRRALGKIVQLEGLEVADQDVPGPLVFRQRVEVLPRLAVRGIEVTACTLLLHDQDTRPEEVDEPEAVVELRDVLFVARHAAAAHAEDLEEVVVEALRFALLVRGIPPITGERGRADTDFVPRQSHQMEVASIRLKCTVPILARTMVEGPKWPHLMPETRRDSVGTDVPYPQSGRDRLLPLTIWIPWSAACPSYCGQRTRRPGGPRLTSL